MPNIDDIYLQSYEAVLPYIRFEGMESRSIDLLAKEIMQKGIDGFKLVVQSNCNNWAAYFMMGKTYQALDENEEAYQAFLVAHNINLEEQNIMRELAFQCLKTKRFDLAAYYSQAAYEFDPEDCTLWANIAVAKLFQRKLEDTEKWAKKTLSHLPDDKPSLRILQFVKEIKDGSREFPNNFDVLEQDYNSDD